MNAGEHRRVAEWMKAEFDRESILYQDVAASGIQDQFGEAFLYINANGNYAINKSVLAEFRRLTQVDAIWVRSGRYWRKREDYDDPENRTES
jgi:hypothetical protein